MLVLDVHRAQTTKTCSKSVTPLLSMSQLEAHISFNLLTSALMLLSRKKLKVQLSDNLESYVTGKCTASVRRTLLTKWIGAAWEEICEDEEMIVRSFKKCGISVSADGSEDDDIHIQGLEDYVFNQSDLASPEDHFASDSEEASDSDPFASDDSDNTSED